MAKTLSPSEIAAQLREMGMPVPAELQEKADNEVNDAIETMFYGKLTSIENENKRIAAAEKFRKGAENYAQSLMTLDSSEKTKQGKGETKYDLRSFTVMTEVGELVVKLYSNPHK